MTVGRGIRNVFTSRSRKTSSQTTSTATNTTTGGSQLPERRRAMARAVIGPLPSRASRKALGADAVRARRDGVGLGAIPSPKRLANLRHELEVALLLARVDVPRLGQVDVDDPRDPTGS